MRRQMMFDVRNDIKNEVRDGIEAGKLEVQLWGDDGVYGKKSFSIRVQPNLFVFSDLHERRFVEDRDFEFFVILEDEETGERRVGYFTYVLKGDLNVEREFWQELMNVKVVNMETDGVLSGVLRRVEEVIDPFGREAPGFWKKVFADKYEPVIIFPFSGEVWRGWEKENEVENKEAEDKEVKNKDTGSEGGLKGKGSGAFGTEVIFLRRDHVEENFLEKYREIMVEYVNRVSLIIGSELGKSEYACFFVGRGRNVVVDVFFFSEKVFRSFLIFLERKRSSKGEFFREEAMDFLWRFRGAFLSKVGKRLGDMGYTRAYRHRMWIEMVFISDYVRSLAEQIRYFIKRGDDLPYGLADYVYRFEEWGEELLFFDRRGLGSLLEAYFESRRSELEIMMSNFERKRKSLEKIVELLK